MTNSSLTLNPVWCALMWLLDAVTSHMGLYWFNYKWLWCSSSQRPTFHPCSPWSLQYTVAQWSLVQIPSGAWFFFPSFQLMQKLIVLLFLTKTHLGECQLPHNTIILWCLSCYIYCYFGSFIGDLPHKNGLVQIWALIAIIGLYPPSFYK